MAKVIYFIRGLPTEHQKKEAAAMQAVIRNPDKVGRPGDFLEKCEAVYGDVIPAKYQGKPRADPPKAAQMPSTAAGQAVSEKPIGLDSLGFEAMSADELAVFAEQNGITFPKSASTDQKKAVYLMKWQAKRG